MSVTKSMFISIGYLKETTPLNDNVDDSKIRTIILATQRMFIEPILGTDLYNKIAAEIIAGTLSGNYATLTNSWIAPCLGWYTFSELIPDVSVQVARGGVYRSNAENSSTASLSELNYYQQKQRDRGEHFGERLTDYLCSNSSLFPEYSTNSNEDLNPIRSKAFRGISLDNVNPNRYERLSGGQRY